MSKLDLQFRSYLPGDEAAICGLFHSLYGCELVPETWRWRFRDSPAGHAFIELVYDRDRLVAHYAVTRVAMHVGARTIETGLSGTTMTHGDYRGLGLFPQLATATYARMAETGLRLVWGFPNTQSHRGFISALDWRDVYEVPTFEAPLSAVRQVPERTDGHIETLSNFDERFDTLWERVSAERAMVGRDRRYLQWRFFDNPSERYIALAVTDDGEVAAYLVYKLYRRSLQVVDMLWREEDAADVLAAEAVRIG